MHRHFRDVVLSNVNKFGADSCIRNLKPIAECDREVAIEYVSEAKTALVKRWYNSEMNTYEAAALFWLVRNDIFFSKNLDADSRVLALDYNELVSKPFPVMKTIYQFAGRPTPMARIVSEVHCNSKGKGKAVNISPEIEECCEAVWHRLCNVNNVMCKS